MLGNLTKIKDHDNLAKDSRTRAIVCTDESAWKAAVIAKKKNKKLDELEKDVADLKQMLNLIIEKLDK